MQDLDELLKATVDHLARSVDVSGVPERLARRRIRWRLVRRLELSAIVAVVLAVTVAGAFVLTRAFGVRHVTPPAATQPPQVHLPLTGNGEIAFAGDGGTGNWDIYVMNPDGTDVKRLTTDPAVQTRPAWSPDGTKIAFGKQDANGDSEIYVMNADGSGITNLTGTAGGGKPAWSPDSTMIAFVRGSEVYVMNADGTGVRQFTHSGEGVADYPAWSPDGTTIAFTSGIASPGQLYLENVDGSGLRTIFTESDPGVADLLRPGSWSPDGSTILFERGPTSYAKDQSVAGIWLIRPDGTGLRRVDADPTDAVACWSPDGKLIVFIRNNQGVYSMNADGTGATLLTDGAGNKYFTSWQPVP